MKLSQEEKQEILGKIKDVLAMLKSETVKLNIIRTATNEVATQIGYKITTDLDLIDQEQQTQNADIRKKVYIVGKVTGEDKIECAHKFAKAEKDIESLGFKAINPLKVVGTWDISWQDAMRLCVAELVKADAVYVLPDAVNSKGATKELDLCATLKIFCSYDPESIEAELS